jgi:hypothetical protein
MDLFDTTLQVHVPTAYLTLFLISFHNRHTTPTSLVCLRKKSKLPSSSIIKVWILKYFLVQFINYIIWFNLLINTISIFLHAQVEFKVQILYNDSRQHKAH